MTALQDFHFNTQTGHIQTTYTSNTGKSSFKNVYKSQYNDYFIKLNGKNRMLTKEETEKVDKLSKWVDENVYE